MGTISKRVTYAGTDVQVIFGPTSLMSAEPFYVILRIGSHITPKNVRKRRGNFK